MTPSERIPGAAYHGVLAGVSDAAYARGLYWVALGSSVSILFSIAISQILLGMGLLLIAIHHKPVPFPPIKLPLTLFVVWTVLSDLFSGDPLAGLPQIRKLFVFGTIILVSAAFTELIQMRRLLIGWIAVASLSALAGFVRVARRHQEAIELRWNTYDYYLDDRIKGFASHWMTFGAEQMIVLLLLLSALMFVKPPKWRVAGWICAAIMWAALMLGLTRSIFMLGVPAGALFLLWRYKPSMLAIVPMLALVFYIAAPFQVRERIDSVINPHGTLDSNSHRYVTRRAGWEMIQAHPWFGLGPERVAPQFDRYVPPEIPRPLPAGWYGHLHNIYLQYAAERGIPALLFMLWMIAKMLLDFWQALRFPDLPRESRAWLLGAIAVTIAILAEGFFEHNLGDSEVLTMFLIVTSIAYGAIRAIPGQWA